MVTIVASPPSGFAVTTADDGRLVVRYQVASWLELAALYLLNFAIMASTFVLVMVIVAGLILRAAGREPISVPGGFDAAVELQQVPPPWAVFFIVGGLMTIALMGTMTGVLLGSTQFDFAPDRLTVICGFWGVPRTARFERADLQAVVQSLSVDDDGEFPDYWHVTIQTRRGVSAGLLSPDNREASDWFGQVVARWAGVPFVPLPHTARGRHGR